MSNDKLNSALILAMTAMDATFMVLHISVCVTAWSFQTNKRQVLTAVDRTTPSAGTLSPSHCPQIFGRKFFIYHNIQVVISSS